MVGEGIADLPRVIANLRTIGYHGPLSLELFNRDLWERDPETSSGAGSNGSRPRRGLTGAPCDPT